ncbi:transmembrane protein, putative (macronuclear) [Tetrahymena thermophila SB210]|uniref:Transmembrane protein, putative n=1 Tax=Tetrahymena thermophila (strain SB210) TaxID=312017 RepID=Q23BN9_TETTS|nr:transmembrane protein, putative [Tetrahymena thermophila SB210]EAR94079.1 transmembrane protein, putative [Tetrahymena thermophila SB210]|eukprot:XP_001014324.1 transmembrane protein, putative [Tetrahymena thermophila SB210]
MRSSSLILLVTITLLLGTTAIYKIAQSQQGNLNDKECMKFHKKQTKVETQYYGENTCDQPLKFYITAQYPIIKQTGWFTIETSCLKKGEQYYLQGFLPEKLMSEDYEEC